MAHFESRRLRSQGLSTNRSVNSSGLEAVPDCSPWRRTIHQAHISGRVVVDHQPRVSTHFQLQSGVPSPQRRLWRLWSASRGMTRHPRGCVITCSNTPAAKHHVNTPAGTPTSKMMSAIAAAVAGVGPAGFTTTRVRTPRGRRFPRRDRNGEVPWRDEPYREVLTSTPGTVRADVPWATYGFAGEILEDPPCPRNFADTLRQRLALLP